MGESTEKYITFTVPIEKEVSRIDKTENIKNTSYMLQLLIVQDLWQVHYQILSIFLKQFIELNVNLDTMIKNVKHAELNKSATFFMNTQILKMI